MSWIICSPFWGVLGRRMAVITFAGRKTGLTISTPISVSRVGDTYTVISSRDRTWWRNLRGGASADLRNVGKTIKVRGEVFENAAEVREKLIEYLTRDAFAAKFLQVRVNPEGELNDDDLTRLISERVLIRLQQA